MTGLHVSTAGQMARNEFNKLNPDLGIEFDNYSIILPMGVKGGGGLAQQRGNHQFYTSGADRSLELIMHEFGKRGWYLHSIAVLFPVLCISSLLPMFFYLIFTWVKVIRESRNDFVYFVHLRVHKSNLTNNWFHSPRRLGFQHSGLPNEGDYDDNSCLMGCCAGAQQMCFNAAKVGQCN